MISFTPDSENNRLYIKMAGSITQEEVEPAVNQLVESIKVLSDGFHVINDIAQFKDVFDGGFDKLAKVLEFLRNQKPGKIFRIVGNSHQNLVLFGKFDKIYGHNDVIYVPTLKDALDKL